MKRFIAVVVLLGAMPWYTMTTQLLNASSTLSVYLGVASGAVLVVGWVWGLNQMVKWVHLTSIGTTHEK